MTEELLLVDDDAATLHILHGVLAGAGYRCAVAEDASVALALVEERPQIAVVISDILMPDVSGLQLVDRLNAMVLSHAPPRVLLLTAEPTFEAAVDALRLGVRDFLVKPVRPAELIDAVRRAMAQALEDRSARPARSPEVEQLTRQAEELVGRLRLLAYRPEQERGGARQQAGHVAAAGIAQPVQGAAAPLAVLETIEQLRRLRICYEHHRLDDVAWDLLLELLRAERQRQRLSVSGLAISTGGVSATTSLRRINELVARGFIERAPDPDDARRDFVTLTPVSHELLSEYLARANAYVSALTG